MGAKVWLDRRRGVRVPVVLVPWWHEYGDSGAMLQNDGGAGMDGVGGLRG